MQILGLLGMCFDDAVVSFIQIGSGHTVKYNLIAIYM